MNAIAFLAQAVILAATTDLPVQALLGAQLIALILQMLWSMRRLLNPHFDMVLIMLGWGGLGMLLPSVLQGVPACHASFGAMFAGMLALSAWPAYRQARCLRAAQEERRLGLTLACDLIGMAVGMAIPLPPVAPWLHHAAMLLGMTLGMGGSMLLLSRLMRLPAFQASR